MFPQSARLYDALYESIDYEGHGQQVLELLQRHAQHTCESLLDVACGTGMHLSFWAKTLSVEGLDIDADLLGIAAERVPEVALHLADMTRFDLGKQFDAVTCLFSSIGYVKTQERLAQALICMCSHVRPGGVLIIEPWIPPELWNPGVVVADFVDNPDIKIARMNISGQEGNVSTLNFEYLVATENGFERFSERHELGLFTNEQVEEILRSQGFTVTYDPVGLRGRGLFIAAKPA